MTFKVIEVDKNKSHSKQAHWTERQRLSAINAYVILGKVTLVAATTGIPEDTLRKWKMSDWWKEKEDEIRRSNKIELSGKLQNVVQKTLVALDDRVTNGDFFFNPKTGAFERKPISATQANKIANDLINQTLQLEKAATKVEVTEEGLDLRLKKLRDEMIRFSKAKLIEGETVKNELPKETPSQAFPIDGNPDTDPPTTDGPRQYNSTHSDLGVSAVERLTGAGSPA